MADSWVPLTRRVLTRALRIWGGGAHEGLEQGYHVSDRALIRAWLNAQRESSLYLRAALAGEAGTPAGLRWLLRLGSRSGPLREQLLTQVGRASQQQQGGLGALEEQVRVVLPGEADPAVQLQHGAGRAGVNLGAVRTGKRGSQCQFIGPAGRTRAGISHRCGRVLDIHQRVGKAVFDGLEGADLAAEFVAVRAHSPPWLPCSGGRRWSCSAAQRHPRQVQHVRQSGDAVAGQLNGWCVVELDAGQSPGLIAHRQRCPRHIPGRSTR